MGFQSLTQQVTQSPNRLPQVGRAVLGPEVLAVDLHDAAHLEYARAHAFPDAIAQRFFAGSAEGAATLGVVARTRGRRVGKVGGEDGRALVFVARVQDVAHGIPNPFRRLDRAQLVEHQHFSLKDGTQDLHLGGGDGSVVGVLYLLQQLAVVVEQAGNVLGADQLLDDADGKMRLADTDGPDQQHAGMFAGILADEALRHHRRLRLRTLVRPGQDVEVGELAVLVALRNAGAVEQLLDVLLALAVAASDAAFASFSDRLPARIVAHWAKPALGFSKGLGRGIHGAPGFGLA